VGTAPWRRRMSAIPLLMSVVLGCVFIHQAKKDGDTVFVASRNFYGAHKLHLYGENSGTTRFYLLSNGGITHGLQFMPKPFSSWPTTYYGATSGVGRALDSLAGPRRVGLVGLGAGTLAAYGRPDDSFRFYEIDPSIIATTQRYFTYLKDTPAKVEIALGDARLSLEAELRRGERQQFDLLALDAFSGDAIPVHLLTQEAMALYLQHLRPGGIIAVHISNRHLDLRAVVEGLAKHHHLQFVTIEDVIEEKDWWLYSNTWILLSADPARFQAEAIRRAADAAPDETARVVDWTDAQASLFSILK
jgi:spermidine synthase